MKKRLAALVLFFTLSLPLCTVVASATEAVPYSSKIFATCDVYMSPGSSAGEVIINYDLRADFIADSIGIASVKIYKSNGTNGTYVTTITGTPNNGLVQYGVNRHRDFYTYTGVSGTSYYAEVTVAAASGSLYDSRTITTNTVKAP